MAQDGQKAVDDREDGRTTTQRWSDEEHARLEELVKQAGEHVNWSEVAARMPGRSGKQCRQRWVNHSKPEARRSGWGEEEEEVIASMHATHGPGWSLIARTISQRFGHLVSDNSVKNHWHATFRSKQLESKMDNLLCCYVLLVKSGESPCLATFKRAKAMYLKARGLPADQDGPATGNASNSAAHGAFPTKSTTTAQPAASQAAASQAARVCRQLEAPSTRVHQMNEGVYDGDEVARQPSRWNDSAVAGTVAGHRRMASCTSGSNGSSSNSFQSGGAFKNAAGAASAGNQINNVNCSQQQQQQAVAAGRAPAVPSSPFQTPAQHTQVVPISVMSSGQNGPTIQMVPITRLRQTTQTDSAAGPAHLVTSFVDAAHARMSHEQPSSSAKRVQAQSFPQQTFKFDHCSDERVTVVNPVERVAHDGGLMSYHQGLQVHIKQEQDMDTVIGRRPTHTHIYVPISNARSTDKGHVMHMLDCLTIANGSNTESSIPRADTGHMEYQLDNMVAGNLAQSSRSFGDATVGYATYDMHMNCNDGLQAVGSASNVATVPRSQTAAMRESGSGSTRIQGAPRFASAGATVLAAKLGAFVQASQPHQQQQQLVMQNNEGYMILDPGSTTSVVGPNSQVCASYQQQQYHVPVNIMNNGTQSCWIGQRPSPDSKVSDKTNNPGLQHAQHGMEGIPTRDMHAFLPDMHAAMPNDCGDHYPDLPAIQHIRCSNTQSAPQLALSKDAEQMLDEVEENGIGWGAIRGDVVTPGTGTSTCSHGIVGPLMPAAVLLSTTPRLDSQVTNLMGTQHQQGFLNQDDSFRPRTIPYQLQQAMMSDTGRPGLVGRPVSVSTGQFELPLSRDRCQQTVPRVGPQRNMRSPCNTRTMSVLEALREANLSGHKRGLDEDDNASVASKRNHSQAQEVDTLLLDGFGGANYASHQLRNPLLQKVQLRRMFASQPGDAADAAMFARAPSGNAAFHSSNSSIAGNALQGPGPSEEMAMMMAGTEDERLLHDVLAGACQMPQGAPRVPQSGPIHMHGDLRSGMDDMSMLNTLDEPSASHGGRRHMLSAPQINFGSQTAKTGSDAGGTYKGMIPVNNSYGSGDVLLTSMDANMAMHAQHMTLAPSPVAMPDLRAGGRMPGPIRALPVAHANVNLVNASSSDLSPKSRMNAWLHRPAGVSARPPSRFMEAVMSQGGGGGSRFASSGQVDFSAQHTMSACVADDSAVPTSNMFRSQVGRSQQVATTVTAVCRNGSHDASQRGDDDTGDVYCMSHDVQCNIVTDGDGNIWRVSGTTTKLTHNPQLIGCISGPAGGSKQRTAADPLAPACNTQSTPQSPYQMVSSHGAVNDQRPTSAATPVSGDAAAPALPGDSVAFPAFLLQADGHRPADTVHTARIVSQPSLAMASNSLPSLDFRVTSNASEDGNNPSGQELNALLDMVLRDPSYS